jgi:hypothetical protein
VRQKRRFIEINQPFTKTGSGQRSGKLTKISVFTRGIQANVLLTSHDLRTATPKVADFGIAKMVDTMATAAGTAGGGEAGARKTTTEHSR